MTSPEAATAWPKQWQFVRFTSRMRVPRMEISLPIADAQLCGLPE